jgi:hypothetical protein
MTRFPPAMSTGRSGALPRVLAAVLAVVVGSVLLAGCSSDKAPSAVTVGWADKSHQAVRVSWQDSGMPNRISIEGVVTASPSYVKYLGADEPNTWAIPAAAFPPDGNYRIAVAVGTSNGGVTSKPARSPMFDTDGPVRPIGAQARSSGDNLVVTWRSAPPVQDFTPGDPLDVPAGRQTYVPVLGTVGRPLRVVGPGTTAHRQVLKKVRPPFLFQLRATNEWSAVAGVEISVRTSATSVAVPTVARFGLPVQLRGRTVQQQVSCEESRCTAGRTTTAGLPLVVLAQSKPGGPWVTAGRGTTRAGGHFVVRAVMPGTRAYRVYAPAASRRGQLSTASMSTAATTRSLLQVSAGFVHGNVKHRNEVVTAAVTARPALTGRAIVQFWTGKAWVNVKAVPITRGRATVTFRATRPGAFAYRFFLPGTTYAGRPVFGTATRSLVLRVL